MALAKRLLPVRYCANYARAVTCMVAMLLRLTRQPMPYVLVSLHQAQCQTDALYEEQQDRNETQ